MGAVIRGLRRCGSESDADRPIQNLSRTAAQHVQAGTVGGSGAWASSLPMDYYSYLLIRYENISCRNGILDGLYSTRTTLFLPSCLGNLRWFHGLRLSNPTAQEWDDILYADGEACACDVITLAMYQRVLITP